MEEEVGGEIPLIINFGASGWFPVHGGETSQTPQNFYNFEASGWVLFWTTVTCFGVLWEELGERMGEEVGGETPLISLILGRLAGCLSMGLQPARRPKISRILEHLAGCCFGLL